MNSILIVEDDNSLSTALQTSLEKHGYKVRVAPKGNDALEQIKQKKPDLILLDLLLPDITGLELLEHFQDDQDVIIMSNIDATMINTLEGKNVIDYVVKSDTSLKEIAEKVSTYFSPKQS